MTHRQPAATTQDHRDRHLDADLGPVGVGVGEDVGAAVGGDDDVVVDGGAPNGVVEDVEDSDGVGGVATREGRFNVNKAARNNDVCFRESA